MSTDPQPSRPLNALSIAAADRKPKHGPGIQVGPTFEDDADAPPKDGNAYYGIDKPCTISMTAGKGEPNTTSRQRD